MAGSWKMAWERAGLRGTRVSSVGTTASEHDLSRDSSAGALRIQCQQESSHWWSRGRDISNSRCAGPGHADQNKPGEVTGSRRESARCLSRGQCPDAQPELRACECRGLPRGHRWLWVLWYHSTAGCWDADGQCSCMWLTQL